MRQMFDVDRCTHRYLIESISNSMHPMVMLSSRFVNFWRTLINSSKLCIRLLARLSEKDNRTVMGRTLNTLVRECGLEDIKDLTATHVKKNLKYHEIPLDEKWRISIADELLQLKQLKVSLDGFTSEEISTMLDYVCTS